MDIVELWELAEKYQKKADDAFANYQETGMGRYETTYRKNEDLAEAMRAAANAADDHRDLVRLKAELVVLANQAVQAAKPGQPPEAARKVLGELISTARIYTSFNGG